MADRITPQHLTLWILGNFSSFFCRLLIFSKSNFSKNSFRNTTRVSNSLDPDQARRLICVQTVCKGYQQTTPGGKEFRRGRCGSDGVGGGVVEAVFRTQ